MLPNVLDVKTAPVVPQDRAWKTVLTDNSFENFAPELSDTRTLEEAASLVAIKQKAKAEAFQQPFHQTIHCLSRLLRGHLKKKYSTYRPAPFQIAGVSGPTSHFSRCGKAARTGSR